MWMNAASILSKQAVILDLKAGTKEAAIDELIDLLVSNGQIRDRAAAAKVVAEREKKMSTGLQDGIAIPHGKTDTVENIAAAIGIKKTGIPFDSLDGHPAQIIVLTLSPLNKPGPHIQFLAEISKSLASAEVRSMLLGATREEDVIATICPEKLAQSA
jgi:PTS system nitrogen regulatory IIA component